jgi:kinesin family protein 11
VEDRLTALQAQQEKLIADLKQRMQGFVQDELEQLKSSQDMLKEKADAFEKSHIEVNEQTSRSKDDVNAVLEEIKLLREDVKNKVGAGLNDLSAAAQKISQGILTEVDLFHTQLHSSYASLGKDFKTTFDDLIRHMNEQQTEAERLREQITGANVELAKQNSASTARIAVLMEEEREQQARERETLMSQISALIASTTQKQQARVTSTLDSVRMEIDQHQDVHNKENEAFVEGGLEWSSRAQGLVGKVVESRETVKNKIKTDFAVSLMSTILGVKPILMILRLQTRIQMRYARSLNLFTTRLRRLLVSRCNILTRSSLA